MKTVYRKNPVEEKTKGIRPRSPTVVLLAVVLVCAVGVTLALLSTLTNKLQNTFALGSVTVEIPEEIDQEGGNIVWSNQSKKVMLQNSGDVNSVVRAVIVPQFKDAHTGAFTGGNLGPLTAPAGNTLVLGDFVIHFAEEFSGGESPNWFYQQGNFYYKKVLAPGEKSSQLITGITLSSQADPEVYQGVMVDVEVIAGALQAEGEAPQSEWNVTVENGGVSPQTP